MQEGRIKELNCVPYLIDHSILHTQSMIGNTFASPSSLVTLW